ncbi:AAA family ATPase, partial [Tateyamaria sp.]
MRIQKFKVTNYRNIIDSDWITTTNVTAFVGQNEAGKSNLFEALYCLNPYVDGATFDPDEDWPVDDWKGRKEAKGTTVCQAYFALEVNEIEQLF